jgi:glycine/D-amino acid oxidase-like deaminating enzyme
LAEPLSGNLWDATARERFRAEALVGDVSADALVVGGGCTGLSAALHLAEGGCRIVVLEAAEPGWGASGRAGGEVLPGLKIDPDAMEERFGEVRGRRLADWSGAAPQLVFGLIECYGIACAPERNGWVQAAFTRREMTLLEGRCRQWAARGAPVELLDRARAAAMLGTRPGLYLGAWLDRRGGSIHPGDYVRGLARVAAGLGVRIVGGARVDRLDFRDGLWTAESGGGVRARAPQVVVATNAYSGGLVRGLCRSIVAVRASQAASAPLSPEQCAVVLPGRQVASDRRRLLVSFRLTPDNRLMIGGPGGTHGATGDALRRNASRTAEELFGPIGDLAWEFGWSGCVALTTGTLPHIHEPEPGLHVALGYNGRGLALATAVGKLVAERVGGRPGTELELPATPLRPIPLHFLASPALSVGQSLLLGLDKVERRIR